MTSQTTTPSVSRFAMTPTRGPRPSVRDVIELRARAEKAEATIERVRALAKALHSGRHVACGQLIDAALDGGE